MTTGLKERFLKVYSNVPLGIRQEIILVLDDGRPISWDVAFVEINPETPLSKNILESLERFNII